MQAAGVFKLEFSSSATVYGDVEQMPITEATPTGMPTNPYGRSKLMVEQVLADVAQSDPRWRMAVLRYFHPVGAHERGLMGEDPNGIPNNLLPYISQVAVGKLRQLSVYGKDYPTPDGTGVGDYIHVMDLVDGHLKPLAALERCSGWNVWNLGTRQGCSVLEMIRAFKKAAGRAVPYQVVARPAGDTAQCRSNPGKAQPELGWRAQRGLEQMMEDVWRWQQANPNGYGKK